MALLNTMKKYIFDHDVLIYILIITIILLFVCVFVINAYNKIYFTKDHIQIKKKYLKEIFSLVLYYIEKNQYDNNRKVAYSAIKIIYFK